MKISITATLLVGAFALPAMAQDSRTLRLGMQGTIGDPQYQGVEEAARLISERTEGRLTLEVFPNSQLGTFTEMMEQVTVGDLDLTLNPFGGMDPWVPRAVIASTAYVVQDFDHLQNIIASDWGQEVVAEFAEVGNWHVVDSWYFGTRQTTGNRGIESLEDFQGFRLRVPNSAPLLAWAEAMGASPTPVAFAEVYLALQTNQVDGQENPLPTIDSMKFMEVQSDLSLTNHVVQDQLILMSTDTWESLSPEDQQIVQEAFEAGGEVNNGIVTSREEELVAQFEAAGANIHRPDTAPFREAMAGIYAEMDAAHGEGTIEQLSSLAEN